MCFLHVSARSFVCSGSLCIFVYEFFNLPALRAPPWVRGVFEVKNNLVLSRSMQVHLLSHLSSLRELRSTRSFSLLCRRPSASGSKKDSRPRHPARLAAATEARACSGRATRLERAMELVGDLLQDGEGSSKSVLGTI